MVVPGEEVGSDASVAGGVVRRLLQLLQLPDEPLPQDPVLDPNVVLDLDVRQLEDLNSFFGATKLTKLYLMQKGGRI